MIEARKVAGKRMTKVGVGRIRAETGSQNVRRNITSNRNKASHLEPNLESDGGTLTHNCRTGYEKEEGNTHQHNVIIYEIGTTLDRWTESLDSLELVLTII